MSFSFRQSPAIQNIGVQANVGVHEQSTARVRQQLSGRHRKSASIERQVRVSDRIDQERVRERAQAVRYDQSGTKFGRQRIRNSDSAEFAVKVRPIERDAHSN